MSLEWEDRLTFPLDQFKNREATVGVRLRDLDLALDELRRLRAESQQPAAEPKRIPEPIRELASLLKEAGVVAQPTPSLAVHRFVPCGRPTAEGKCPHSNDGRHYLDNRCHHPVCGKPASDPVHEVGSHPFEDDGIGLCALCPRSESEHPPAGGER